MPQNIILEIASMRQITYTYDSLSRLTKREVAGILTENYSFLAGSAANTTTSMVSQYQVKDADTNALLHGYSYEYDAVGNITKITENGAGYTDYTYDTVNQLLTAKDYNTAGTLVKEYTYTYDTYGNIRTSSNGTTSHTYTYGDAEWLDLLTAYDGNTITYDTSGNPLTYHDGTTFTWRNGRQLATLTKNSQTTSYEYNLNGLRTKKTNPDGSYSIYHWMGSTLLAEEVYTSANVRSYALRFSYDELGRAVGVAIQEGTNTDWTFYYYGRNLQGDVIALYLYTTGTLVAEYDYDPWGKLLSVTDANGNTITGASHIALRNPLRYRGYYYDTDTGFYYLQARYYDPSICRFINADSYAITGQGYLGCNMFAYCLNNPPNYFDADGCDAEAIATGWTAGMWWLTFADGILPIGDIIYGVGCIALGIVVIVSAEQTADTIKEAAQNSAEDKTSGAKAAKSTDKIDWGNRNTANHVLKGTKNGHVKGWQQYGIDPHNNSSWSILLPVLKKVVSDADGSYFIKNQDGSTVTYYFKSFVQEGVQIVVKLWASLDGLTEKLSDAWAVITGS